MKVPDRDYPSQKLIINRTDNESIGETKYKVQHNKLFFCVKASIILESIIDRSLWDENEYNWCMMSMRNEKDEKNNIHNATLRVYSILNGSMYSMFQPILGETFIGWNTPESRDNTPFFYDTNPPTDQTYIRARTKGIVCAGFTNIVLRESNIEIYGANTKVPGGVPDEKEALALNFKRILLSDDKNKPVRCMSNIEPIPSGSFLCAPFLDMNNQGHLAILIESNEVQYVLSCLPAWSETADYAHKGTLYRSTARKHIEIYGKRIKYKFYCPPESIKNWNGSNVSDVDKSLLI